MNKKRRVHDGIVGTVIAAGVGLGIWVNPVWFWLPGVIGVLMIQSSFTGFCPVYYTLDKLGVPEHSPTPGQAN